MAGRHRSSSISALRSRIEKRAAHRCEYCHAPQSICGYRFHLEHVVPVALGGADALSNRALACAACNLAKADRVAGVDPLTRQLVLLFDPRTATWGRHFRWEADLETIAGRTKVGRVTIAALDMNAPFRKEARRLWFETGWLP